jgi:predicted nucleic acid-binding protein
MWVFDATPLIYLAKVDGLSLIDQFDEPCVIPQQVYAEVVETGLEQGYPDARRIERSVENGVFDVVAVENTAVESRLRENPNLSDADIAVLACAAGRNGVAIMDEVYGRDTAATEGITTRGTAYLVLLAASQNVVSVDEARALLDAMIDEGWYCAPDVYAKLVRKLESMDG